MGGLLTLKLTPSRQAKCRMEKVVFKTTLKDKPSDLAFWLSRTVQERFAALESLRQQYAQTLPIAQQRLQIVCTVSQRQPG